MFLTMLDRSITLPLAMQCKGKGKRPKDSNLLAKSIVDEATGVETEGQQEKNPAAVALGRLGGLKGGKARAEKLSAKRRSEIAKVAALTRWKTAESGGSNGGIRGR